MIAETTVPESDPTTQSTDIPEQQSIVKEAISISKSKWDDEEEDDDNDDDNEMITDSSQIIEQNQIQSES
jgi:hypothetical protein